MLAENHVMQVLYKNNFHIMIKSCYARSFIRKMYIKSCYGKFFGTNINIMLCKIMLWVYHVRRGLAVPTTYYMIFQIIIHITHCIFFKYCNSIIYSLKNRSNTFSCCQFWHHFSWNPLGRPWDQNDFHH